MKKKLYNPKFSPEDIKKIMKKKLSYSKAGPQWLHCQHCLQKYLEERDKNNGISPKSPRDTFNYEASSYPFTYPDGITANIIVLWCKTCGRNVWDTRHLKGSF